MVTTYKVIINETGIHPVPAIVARRNNEQDWRAAYFTADGHLALKDGWVTDRALQGFRVLGSWQVPTPGIAAA